MHNLIDKKIGSIDFKLLDPDTVREMSSVRVVVPDIYDDAGYPIEGGLMDLRMGVVDPGLRCKTCGGRKDSCTGHFGHIELVRPTIHVGYSKKIYNILRSTCKKCGRVTIPEEELEELEDAPEEGKYFFRKVRDKAKKKDKCPHCGEEQPDIKFRRPTSYFENDQRIWPNEIRERFERIPTKDLPFLNIDPEKNRPENMIFTVLPVPPVTTRPSITLETGNKSEDDLTHKLIDVLRINQRLADNISAGAPQPIIEDLWDLLQYHITTYFDNESSGIPAAKHRSGRSLKTLTQRIKGKHGRIRQHLTGKRVDFSGRTVISPDPSLSIGEIGVPKQMAKDFTVPEKVTEENLERIKKYIENEEYPRAEYIEKPNGERRKITELNREEITEEIGPGYTIHRHLVDGDTTIFNRQPSLHRLSMLQHTARIMPGKTLRLNDGIAEPYNADYDGDEMNIHIPQNVEAQVEAKKLMSVKNNLVSPKHGKILAGSHDNVTGLATITQDDITFTKEEALRLLKKVDIHRYPGEEEKEEYTGKELVSELIPDTVTVEIESNLSEEPVVVEKGQIKQGVMDEKTFGGDNKLTREIWDIEGPERAEKFVNDMAKFTVEALKIKGHTVSLKDYKLTEEGEERMNNVIKEKEDKAENYISQYREGEIKTFPGKSEKETLEAQIKRLMSEIGDRAWEIAMDDLGTDNYAIIMARSGARGSPKNVTQMSCALGQMGSRGGRLSRGYKGRILPHYKKGTLSPEKKGFIPNSFVEGMEPDQYYQQSMSGRDSLIDKGIEPAKSGYMQRRMVNALLDLMIRHDQSVRNANDEIIQFKYGEDGIDPKLSRKDTGIDIDRIIRMEEEQ